MNRFATKSRSRDFPGLILPVSGFILILFLFFAGVGQISQSSGRQELESLTQAVHRNIIHCYAIEGQYPPSLEYMEEHYGLTYDPSRYFIDYQPSGANIMPSVTIIPLEGAGS